MKFRVVYGPQARTLARHLQPDLKPVIKQAIESLRTDPYAGKPLKLELAGYRSLRTQRYRVIYRLLEQQREVQVLYFGRRTDVYESFYALLRRAGALDDEGEN